MEHRIPEGDIGPDFGKHGKHLCKGPSKDGNVCANAGTDREAYCTYSLGPALYPEEFPVDLHFCAYRRRHRFSPFALPRRNAPHIYTGIRCAASPRVAVLAHEVDVERGFGRGTSAGVEYSDDDDPAACKANGAARPPAAQAPAAAAPDTNAAATAGSFAHGPVVDPHVRGRRSRHEPRVRDAPPPRSPSPRAADRALRRPGSLAPPPVRPRSGRARIASVSRRRRWRSSRQKMWGTRPVQRSTMAPAIPPHPTIARADTAMAHIVWSSTMNKGTPPRCPPRGGSAGSGGGFRPGAAASRLITSNHGVRETLAALGRVWRPAEAREPPVRNDRSRAPTSGPLDCPVRLARVGRQHGIEPATKTRERCRGQLSVEKKWSKPYCVEKRPSLAAAAAQTKTNDGSRAIRSDASHTFCGGLELRPRQMDSRREWRASPSRWWLHLQRASSCPSITTVLAPVAAPSSSRHNSRSGSQV